MQASHGLTKKISLPALVALPASPLSFDPLQRSI
jgi:hypothetical protein